MSSTNAQTCTGAQAVPMLTLSVFCSQMHSDTCEPTSSKEQSSGAFSNVSTCSTTSISASGACSVVSDASDDDAASSMPHRPRWADIESDDEEYVGVAAPPQPYQTCTPTLATMPPRQQRTPLRTSAMGYSPEDAFKAACRLDFAKVVAAGLLAMRNSPIVATSVVKECAGGGWTLSCVLQANANERFTAIQAVTHQVQGAVLQAVEVSKQSYVLGYITAPFAPLGLGFSFELVAVPDEANACWDLIGSGQCTRGCSCRWHHPAEHAIVEVTIATGVCSS